VFCDEESTFDHVELLDRRFVGLKPFADFHTYRFRRFAGGFHPGENDNGDIALEFFSGGLRHDVFGGSFNAIQIFDRVADGQSYDTIDRHFYCDNFVGFELIIFNKSRVRVCDETEHSLNIQNYNKNTIYPNLCPTYGHV